MDERGWLQRVTLAFFPQVAGSKLAEFAVHEGREVIEGILVALRPFGKQQRYFMGVRHGFRVDNAELQYGRIIHLPQLHASASLGVRPQKQAAGNDRFPLCFAHE